MSGKAPSEMSALQPYRGKPAVRNDRGDRGNVGIIEARSAPRSYPTALTRRDAPIAGRYALRCSGTLPPVSASLVMTCRCSHTFISAEPSSAPV